jgi:hypothetical protein
MSEDLIVYWSPVYNPSEANWNILYDDFESLYQNKVSDINKNNKKSMFACPSFTNLSKNTLLAINPLKSHYGFSNLDMDRVTINNKIDGGLLGEILHDRSANNRIVLQYALKYVFFTEEDSLKVTITSPYFNKSNHLKYGGLVPGEFDIGKWFRSLNFAYELWDGVDEFVIEKEEVAGYIQFHTDRKVVLKRFKINPELLSILYTTGTSSSWMPRVGLPERYDKFKKSRTKDIVLREIKNNLIDN